jgi:hypothetical protein
LLLRYTSNPDDRLWSAEVLSLGRCEQQTLEQHFPSIPHSGWRSIVVNKATYKKPAFTISGKKDREVARDCRTTANNFSSLKNSWQPKVKDRLKAISEVW